MKYASLVLESIVQTGILFYSVVWNVQLLLECRRVLFRRVHCPFADTCRSKIMLRQISSAVYVRKVWRIFDVSLISFRVLRPSVSLILFGVLRPSQHC